MANVIPNAVLECMTCILCDKYLTVGPVGVHPDGDNICGRCLYKENAPQSLFAADELNDQTIPIPIFGYINHLFPCINRFGGCKKLLPLRCIREHELKCHSAKVACKNCDYEGIGSQVLQHFRKVHQDLVDHCCFIVDLNDDLEKTFLFRNEDCLVFVDLCFQKDKTKIVFNYRILGDAEIGLSFNLTDHNGKLAEYVPYSATYLRNSSQFCHIIVFDHDYPIEVGQFSCKFEVQFDKKRK